MNCRHSLIVIALLVLLVTSCSTKQVDINVGSAGSNSAATNASTINSNAGATSTPDLGAQAVAEIRREMESSPFTKCGDMYVLGMSSLGDESGVYQYSNPKFVFVGANPVTEADKLNGISWSGKVEFRYNARKASLYRVNNRIDETSWMNYQSDTAFSFTAIKSGSSWRFDSGNPVRFRHFIKVPCQTGGSSNTSSGATSNTSASNDLSDTYGIIGNAIFNKKTHVIFHTPDEFFADSGKSSFDGLKYDRTVKKLPPDIHYVDGRRLTPEEIRKVEAKQ